MQPYRGTGGGAASTGGAGSELADCLCVTGLVLGAGVADAEVVAGELVGLTPGILAGVPVLFEVDEPVFEAVFEAVVPPPRTRRYTPPAMSRITTTSTLTPVVMTFLYITIM
jgi:hypothetical protein